jgi:hypothetical protein
MHPLFTRPIVLTIPFHLQKQKKAGNYYGMEKPPMDGEAPNLPAFPGKDG